MAPARHEMSKPSPSESVSGLVAEEVLFATGRVKYTGFYLNGESHGEWAWYRLDGSLMRTGAFDRGRQVGTWRTFDRAGRLVKETAFK